MSELAFNLWPISFVLPLVISITAIAVVTPRRPPGPRRRVLLAALVLGPWLLGLAHAAVGQFATEWAVGSVISYWIPVAFTLMWSVKGRGPRKSLALGFGTAAIVIVFVFLGLSSVAVEKPVIYLYPRARTTVNVRLSTVGVITKSAPTYTQDGWSVVAEPTGQLLDKRSGEHWPYLFWEAQLLMRPDFSEGFVVPGDSAAGFLSETLPRLGLNETEARDFSEYWLPRLSRNPYNLISFQGESYTNAARLHVTPRPDTTIRVFMSFTPLAAPVEVSPQRLSNPPARNGFTLVEWGGAEY